MIRSFGEPVSVKAFTLANKTKAELRCDLMRLLQQPAVATAEVGADQSVGIEERPSPSDSFSGRDPAPCALTFAHFL